MKPYLYFSEVYIALTAHLSRHFADEYFGSVTFIESGTNWVKLPICDGVHLEVSSERQNGAVIYTTEFEARLLDSEILDKIDAMYESVCFLLKTPNGAKYMVGTSERPDPSLSYKYNSGIQASEAGYPILTVSWRSKYAPLEVIENY